MKQKTLNVKLLSVTENAIDLIYASCRQCYSKYFAGNVFFIEKEKDSVNQEEKEKFIRQIVQSGHESPLEHVSFYFAVEGISRACSHQLVRHRLASYSQQSQRYIKKNDFWP